MAPVVIRGNEVQFLFINGFPEVWDCMIVGNMTGKAVIDIRFTDKALAEEAAKELDLPLNEWRERDRWDITLWPMHYAQFRDTQHLAESLFGAGTQVQSMAAVLPNLNKE